MNADRRAAAWLLVQTYMHAHMHEVPPPKRRKFESLDQDSIAPLGALVAFELARRDLSYTQAAVEIGRNLPDHLRAAGPSLAPSTLFYFQKPERATWRAQAETLEQLAYGFGWDLAWLRRVNVEPQTTDHTDKDQELPATIAAVVSIMRDLPDDLQRTILRYVQNFAADPVEFDSHARPAHVARN